MTSHHQNSNNHATILLAVFALFFSPSVLSQNTSNPKWQVTHHPEGHTRFEINHENQPQHFEFRIIGYRVDGEIKRFSPPKVTTTDKTEANHSEKSHSDH